MSIAIVCKGFKPSDLLKAARALYPSLPETGWEMLDVLGIEREGRIDSRQKYFREYALWEEPLMEVRRLSVLMPTAPKGAAGKARDFLQREVVSCQRRMREIEGSVTPHHVQAFFESQLQAVGARAAVVPSRGIDVRFPGGEVLWLLPNCIRTDLYSPSGAQENVQLLRYASFKGACAFLRQLPDREYPEMSCHVVREGVAYGLTYYWRQASVALRELTSRDGREKAHRKLPPFTDEGDLIPA